MGHTEELFARADMQRVREFIKYGGDGPVDPRSYDERLDRAYRDLNRWLAQRFPEEPERTAATETVFQSVTALEDVYLELGLLLGAKLALQQPF